MHTSHLVDSALLKCNFFYRLAQHKDMIYTERRDACHDRLGDNIGRVKGAAYSDFDNTRIDLTVTVSALVSRAQLKALSPFLE